MAKVLLLISLVASAVLVKGALPSVHVSTGGSGLVVSTAGTQPAPQTNATGGGLENTTANWSGYAVTGSNYTAVSGAWTVPQASSADPDSADAAWIGIGGMDSTDLIQVGTQDQVNPDGSTQSTAFYELLPDSETTIQTISVNPGDHMQAGLSQDGSGLWTIQLTDTTTGQSFETQTYYNSTNSSAEWIEEDPSDGAGQVPLDNFGSVTFTNASTTTDGTAENLSQAGAQSYTMASQAGLALVSVSGSSGGGGFTVTRTSASSTSGQSPSGHWYRHGEGIGRWQRDTTSPYTTGGGYPRVPQQRWWRAFGF